ncbi:MAG TPA: hypothetical protein ENI06_07045 [Spirochaetales bacterium]|nr:hypothetical protein [Spirochaetales bacterium]
MKKPLLSALLIILLSSCAPKDLEQSTEAKPLPGKWFILRQGHFESIEAPSTSIRPQPWTVQSRVAALSALDHKVFLAVNGWGIVSLDITSLSDPHFEYFYDPLIFRNRTITSLFPDKKTLICHLYFNTLLNTVQQQDLKIQGISLIKLFPIDSIYRFIIPPFQRQNPEWESVSFLVRDQDEFLFEWKHSSPEETYFHYTLLNYREQKEESVDRLLFRESFAFQRVNDLKEPSRLVLVIKKVIKTLIPAEQGNKSTALHFLLKEGDSGVRKRYKYYPPGFSSARHPELYTINLIKRGEDFIALLPQGTLLRTGPGEKDLRILDLPPTPEDIIFTDLYIEDNFLVAAWEEVHFINVGTAGIFLLDISFWH